MSLALKIDFVNDPNLDNMVGISTLPITRATTKTFSDWENVLRTAQTNERAVTGCRRVENLCLQSEDFSTTWVDVGTPPSITSTNEVDPNGGNTASEIAFPAMVAGGDASVFRQTVGVAGIYTTRSIYVKAAAAGDVGKKLILYGSSAASTSVITLTSAYQRIEHTSTVSLITFGVLGTNFNNGFVQDAVNVHVWGAQYEVVSGQADTSPSEYQATTTAAVAKTYATKKNGAALDTPVTGLSVEEARTNICTYSENFDTNWAKVAATIDQAASAAPDGTVSMARLDSTGAGFTSTKQSFSVPSGSNTFTVYAKKDIHDWVIIQSEGFDTSEGGTSFDLVNGVVGTTGTGITASIEDVGGGIYRCRITFSTTIDLTGSVIVYTAEADNDANTPASSSIFLWGAQLEAGSFPTSYIPTVASSVTRNADVVNSDDVSWFDAAEGTLYLDSDTPAATGQDNIGVSVNDASNSDRCYLARFTSGQGNYAQVVAGSTVAQLIGGTAYTTGSVKQVAAYALDDVEHYVEGVRTGTGDQLAANIISPSRISVGGRYDGNSNHFNGHIAEIRYYNTRLTNQQLEDMSNGIFPTFGFPARRGNVIEQLRHH